jgi:hypothetical protein
MLGRHSASFEGKESEEIGNACFRGRPRRLFGKDSVVFDRFFDVSILFG